MTATKKNLLLKIEQIKYADIPLCDAGLLHVTSLRASLRMYGSEYSRYNLLLGFHHGLSADNVTTLLNGGITVDHKVSNNRAKFRLLDGRQRLETMQMK